MAQYDTAILGGRLIDGSGNPWFVADLGIRDGRVATVGRISPDSALTTVDATDLVVCPGFIDMHTHSDIPLLMDGDAQSKVRQGVTFDVIGESATVAPLTGPAAEQYHLDQHQRFNFEVDWADFDGYFDRLKRQGVSINVASGVSPQQIKRVVVGFENRAATVAEVGEMERLTAEAMAQGALGLTSAWHGGGPEFPEEVVSMAAVVARYGGYYGVHIGSEGFDTDQEMEKALRVGRESDIPVHIYHIKVRGKRNWGRAGELIETIEAARRNGLDVTANQYPYTAMQHPWSRLVPRWVQDAPRNEIVPRFGERTFRDRLKADPEFQQYVEEHGGWENIVASVIRSPQLKAYEGKRATEIARLREEPDAAEAAFDLIFEANGFPHGVYHNMSDDDLETFMRLPWVAVASDGTALNDHAPGFPHPRSFGTNVRVLGRYVREKSVLSLEDAVRKMTSLPAQVLRLSDRGALREGCWADVVLFDPDTVADEATYEAPKQYAAGVRHVFVNGEAVVTNGQHTGARPGQVIYGPGRR